MNDIHNLNNEIDALIATSYAEPLPEVQDMHVPSIASSGKLVSLTRHVPDMTKSDKAAARALAKLKGAKSKAVSAKKKLIESKVHEALQEQSRAIYRYHIAATLPWGNLGQRYLPNVKLIDYINTLGIDADRNVLPNSMAYEFYELKNQFLDDYARAAAAAQEHLGDMFDESQYPSVYELDRKVGIRVDYEFIADPDDHRVKIGDEAARAMHRQYEGVLKRRMEAAYADVFERLRKPLVNMSSMLDYSDAKDKTGFRDTLVSNITNIVELMRTCNVTNDPTMTNLTNQLRDTLSGVTPDMLRTNVQTRLSTKLKVDQIIKNLPEPSLDF